MKTPIGANGHTMIEMVLAAAMISIVMLSLVLFSSKIGLVIKRVQVRQQVQGDARSCMDTITQRLRNGKARSLIISTPNVGQLVPNSRVDFNLQTPLPSGATSYVILLSNNVIYTQELGGPVGVGVRRPIASRVGGLMFTGDSRDPAIVRVVVLFAAPWDQTNDPAHVTTFNMAQEIHMVDTQ